MPRWLPSALMVSGSVGILIGAIVVPQSRSGFWPLAGGLVSIFLGLLANRIEALQRESFRAVTALGFFVLALALFYSGTIAIGNGEPGAATFRIGGGLAALYVALGWTFGLIAEDRIKSGKDGSLSRWAARVWRPRSAKGR